MRGDGPIRSAIGSLRRTATGCGAIVVTAGRAGAEGSAGLGTLLVTTGDGFGVAKNGAGCDPDCK